MSVHSRTGSSIQVVVVDSTRMASQLLAAALMHEKFDVVYAGASPEEALHRASQTRVDIALISATFEASPNQGYELATKIRDCGQSARVVMLVDGCNKESVVHAFKSGARGILSRDDSMSIVCKCVRRVHEGQIWASNEALSFVLEALSSPARIKLLNANGAPLLAPREQEVVHWVFEGYTNREVADRLGLSENTVKNYLFRIFDKLGISKRVELIVYAAAQIDAQSRVPAPVHLVDPASALKDNQLLFRWCRSAVDTVSLNEYAIGEMYRDGRGVPKDKRSALMWFNIAESVAEEMITRSRAARRSLQAELTPAEVQKAESAARERLGSNRWREPKRSEEEIKPAA